MATPLSSVRRRRGTAALLSSAATTSLIVGLVGWSGGSTAHAAETLLSQGKPVVASSVENPDYTPAKYAVDGDLKNTRWSSERADPQTLQVDLQASASISSLVLTWEAAYATGYTIEVSPTGAAGTWTQLYATTTGKGGTERLTVSGTGRFVRLTTTKRVGGYGVSLWEFQVFGTVGGTGTPTPTVSPTPTKTPTPTPTVTPTPTPTPTGTLPTSDTPDLGASVTVLSPGQTDIQARLDAIFNAQKVNQFGSRRDAILFKPGTYPKTYINLGYNTSVAGLGQNPDDVKIDQGSLTVDAFDGTGNATQNFWRSAENMEIIPVGGEERWAVSQAAPFRRMHVLGSMTLCPSGCGYSSGGFIADSVVTGQISSGSQQQFYTRDSSIGSWVGGNWNMVFSGVQGAPPQVFPKPSPDSNQGPWTTLGTTPLSREKPYLYIDGAGKYRVFVPSLRTNASGSTWLNGQTPGTSIPLSQFYVAKPADSAARINSAFAQGLNVLFTPGIYHVNQTLSVTKANTVVLGLGYATIVPDNGVDAVRTADVDGIKLAGLLIDAGPVNSNALLTVGASGSTANHAANPTTVQDVFFRVGGGDVTGRATNSLIVNSRNTIVDHTWAWRADHATQKELTGWTVNTAANGVVVNGDNVLITGLFSEHYQKYNVLWNGQGGRTIFYQNELPYDVPDQASWNESATFKGYPAYKVAANVTTHEGWGLGAYAFFQTNPAIVVDSAFEAPVNAGVKFHDLVTISIVNKGTILHVVNGVGPATNANTQTSNVVSYP